jgi:hypothetical protein
MRDDLYVCRLSLCRGVFYYVRLSLRASILQRTKQSPHSWEIAASGCRPPRNDMENRMEIGETIYVTTREEFRAWLEENHRLKKEIWLIQYKKVTRKPSIPYVEAVEEAICYGWIDGFEKGMDGDRYATRFTRRRPKSNWTETNKERAQRMIAEGKMTESGRMTLPPEVLKAKVEGLDENGEIISSKASGRKGAH